MLRSPPSDYPSKGIQVEDLADRSGFPRLGTQPMAIDLLPEIPGVEFDAAWERRAESVLDASTGLKAFYLSKDDLIASKLASGHLRDLADVEAIRKASQSVDSSTPDGKSPEEQE